MQAARRMSHEAVAAVCHFIRYPGPVCPVQACEQVSLLAPSSVASCCPHACAHCCCRPARVCSASTSLLLGARYQAAIYFDGQLVHLMRCVLPTNSFRRRIHWARIGCCAGATSYAPAMLPMGMALR